MNYAEETARHPVSRNSSRKASPLCKSHPNNPPQKAIGARVMAYRMQRTQRGARRQAQHSASRGRSRGLWSKQMVTGTFLSAIERAGVRAIHHGQDDKRGQELHVVQTYIEAAPETRDKLHVLARFYDRRSIPSSGSPRLAPEDNSPLLSGVGKIKIAARPAFSPFANYFGPRASRALRHGGARAAARARAGEEAGFYSFALGSAPREC